MNQQLSNNKEATYKKWVVILSAAIPLAVALLFGVNLKKLGFDVQPLTILPPIYASINGLTAVILVLALVAIKNKKRELHEKLMKFALLLSALFLVLYVAYHMTSDSTKFGGDGAVKMIYYFILISHIILSITIIPFVLLTYLRAILGKFEDHKKLARIAYPLWLYVAITGVVVYIMISPYYV